MVLLRKAGVVFSPMTGVCVYYHSLSCTVSGLWHHRCNTAVRCSRLESSIFIHTLLSRCFVTRFLCCDVIFILKWKKVVFKTNVNVDFFFQRVQNLMITCLILTLIWPRKEIEEVIQRLLWWTGSFLSTHSSFNGIICRLWCFPVEGL